MSLQHLKTERQLWRLLGVIAGAATLAAIYGVFQGFGADPFEQRIAGRVQSTFANPLFAGSFFAMALPLTLGVAFVAAHKYRLHIISAVWTLAIAIQFLAIMFTLSRGPWVAGMAGVLSILALVWVAR